MRLFSISLLASCLVIAGCSGPSTIDSGSSTQRLSPEDLRMQLQGLDYAEFGEVTTDDTGATWAKWGGIPIISIPAVLEALDCAEAPELPSRREGDHPDGEAEGVESGVLFFDGSPAVVLSLADQTIAWAWRADAHCWAQWEVFRHPVGDPAPLLILELFDNVVIDGEAPPASGTLDISSAHVGDEEIVLGEFGLTIESAAGEQLFGFLFRDDVSARGFSFQDLALENDIVITVYLEVYSAEPGIMFLVNATEDIRGSQAYEDEIAVLLHWDSVSAQATELWRSEISVGESRSAGLTQNAIAVHDFTFFPTAGGRLVHRWNTQSTLYSTDCVAARAVMGDNVEGVELPGPDDPCCYVRQTITQNNAGWNFVPLGANPVEVLRFEPGQSSVVEPVECAD